MNWNDVWRALQDKNYPDSFKKWAESMYDVSRLTVQDLPLFGDTLAEDYAAQNPGIETYQDPTSGQWFYKYPNINNQGQATGGYTWKPFSPKAPPYDEKANGGYEPGKVYKFTTSDGKAYYAQYQGEGNWGAASWDESSAITPYQQAQLDADQRDFNYRQEQDSIKAQAELAAQALAAQQYVDQANIARRKNDLAARQAALDQWLASNASSPEAQQQNAYNGYMQGWKDMLAGLNGPQDWLNKWTVSQNKPVKPGIFNSANNAWIGGDEGNYGFATSAQDAQQKGLTGWVDSNWQGNDPGAPWMDKNRQIIKSDPLYPQGRPETDQEYDYRVNQQRMAAARTTGAGGWNRGATGDPAINSAVAEWYKYNTNPMDESQWGKYRAGYGIGGPNDSLVRRQQDTANWNTDLNNFINDQSVYAARAKAGALPKVPDWAYQFGIPTTTYSDTLQGSKWTTGPRVDVTKLKTGNWLAPVGAQTWNKMAPSEQSGLRGLVEASGQDWGDYMSQSSRMWPSSTGPTARTKVTAF